MSDTKLPDCWRTERLDQLAKFIDYRGKTPKKKTEGLPLITAKNVRDGYIKKEPREYIAIADYDEWMTRGIPKEGDVVITTEAPMGNVALLDITEKFAIAQRVICLQFFSKAMGRFAHYALRSPDFQKTLKLNSTGTTVSGIKAATLKGLVIPLPPLAEQKAIADKLDTLLAQVENTKVRLERIPQILKRFRQSVLAAAVSGRLTDDGEIGDESWSPTKLANLCTTAFDGPFGSKLKSSDYTNGGVGVVRLENIRHLEFDHSKETFISEDKYQTLIKNKLEKNDILFSSFVDEEVRACLFPFETLRFINKADCFCLRIDQRKALPEFVLYLLTSQISYAQIKEHVQGVTRPRVNLKILKSLEFPVPPLEKQAEVVRKVNQLFAHADRIEQQVNNALARVNNLTQSILAKAFRGELTEQWRKDNPELISGENSAEALLERIKAERAEVKPAKKTRSKRATV